ncbi:MAG: hypothetical protein ACRDPU_10590, partial [Thermoleophilia bacterium]
RDDVRYAARGTTARRRSLACTRTVRTARRRSSGRLAKQSAQSVRPPSSSCIRSPARGVRRHSAQDVVLGASVPMLLRTSMEASSGMKTSSAPVRQALPTEKSPQLPHFSLD